MIDAMNEVMLFDLALEKPSAERAAFLDEVCAADHALHRRIALLLRAHEKSDEFIARPAVAYAAGSFEVADQLKMLPGTDPSSPNAWHAAVRATPGTRAGTGPGPTGAEYRCAPLHQVGFGQINGNWVM